MIRRLQVLLSRDDLIYDEQLISIRVLSTAAGYVVDARKRFREIVCELFVAFELGVCSLYDLMNALFEGRILLHGFSDFAIEARENLLQLSFHDGRYSFTVEDHIFGMAAMVKTIDTRLELVTCSLEDCRSIQLS